MEEKKLNNEVVAENAITDDTEIDVGMIEESILFDKELHKEQHVWLLKGSIWKTYSFSKILDLIHRLQSENSDLREENAILKGNPPMIVGRRNGKTIRAKLLAFDKMKEKNDELQKQVDELMEQRDVFKNLFENCNNSSITTDEIINAMNSFYREQAEHLAELKIEKAIKDTASEILGLILAKEFEKGDYLTDDELKELFKERYDVEVE